MTHQATGNSSGQAEPIGTEEVLREEAKEIHGDRAKVKGKSGRELNQELNRLDSAALCLSGGGIRSAAFSLGVIQALASHPRRPRDDWSAEHSLLSKFHYLSTVSGGGYIGSWFSAWLKRSGFASVWQGLVGRRDKPENEAEPIAWLRSYSNFLTPQLGITSADTWGAIALVLRNLILNWLVLLPALCMVLIVLKLFAGGMAAFSRFDPESCEPSVGWMAIAAAVLLILSLAFATRHRPTRGRSQAEQGRVLLLDLLPAMAAGVLMTFALASPCVESFVRNAQLFSVIPVALLPGLVLTGIAIYVVAWGLALPRWRRFNDFFGDFLAWMVAGAVYGALVAAGVYLYVKGVPDKGFWPFVPKETLLLVIGVPWALTAQMTAEMVFVGLTSWEDDSDADREWLARAAGWFLIAGLCWVLLMLLVFVGSRLVNDIYDQAAAWLVAGGAGGITAWLGKSSASPAKGPAKDRTQFWTNVALAVAGPVFAAALVIALSTIIDQVLFGRMRVLPIWFNAPLVTEGYPRWPGLGELLTALLVIGVVGVGAWKFVNINRFSLHALYRNRLVRAFLGASNKERSADRDIFTDFAESDNLRMHELRSAKPEAGSQEKSSIGWRPFHVVNIALNIVSTKRLAWQERKAESFTVTPLHAGTACGGVAPGASGTLVASGAFRPSNEYGGDEGISFGTAMAISGAAASPNMGYHSSPSLAILLTLLNVRLGWWLGNPGKEGKTTFAYEGPRTAIVPLLNEMFGQTTDDNPYVYLSDGGHFENLGLYEMVRRRCRCIVVVDAGCDMNFEFEDLGNAVRKIRLDLGIDIFFRGLGALRHRPRKNFTYRDYDPPFHALGTINYKAVDGDGKNGGIENGTILYIKPAFHRNRLQDVGVANYALCHPSFPHEGTGDQFFSESQFESYRTLGFDIADDILSRASDDAKLPANSSMEQMFAALDTTILEFPLSETSPERPPQTTAQSNERAS